MTANRKRKNYAETALAPRTVILAGGKGTRLLPYTANFPKPLMPIGERPVVEILIRQLVKCGLTDITLTLGHLAELTRAYFSHRADLTSQIDLKFVQEEQPTGTAGSLALVPGLDSTFLVANGDILTNLNFMDLIRFHKERSAILTIASHVRKVGTDFGVIQVDEGNRVTDYLEKPEYTHLVSMGIYVYEPEVLRYIKANEYLNFPDLVLRLIAANQLVCSYPTDCLWLDIGRPDDYARAQELAAARPEEFDLA